MVFILDGNSAIGTQVGCNPCYLICLRHLIRLISDANQTSFLHACATYSDLPSNISSMGSGSFPEQNPIKPLVS